MNLWFENSCCPQIHPNKHLAFHTDTPARALGNAKRPIQKVGGDPQAELFDSAVNMQLIQTKQGLNPIGFSELPADL